MLKNISKFEFQVGEKVYQFFCDVDAPIDHAKIAITQFYNYLLKIEESAKKVEEKNSSEKIEPIIHPSDEGNNG